MAEEFLPSEGFTEVQYVDLHGSSSHKATAAGEIDFGSNFIGPTLTRLEAGDPLVLLSGTHVGCFELFAREQVRAVRDLKGKTMAVRQLGSTEHTFIASILAYVGIDPQKEVHWVTHPFDASTQLFAEGTIDAVAAQPPQSQELRARQIGHVLINSTVDRPWSQYYCCMVYTHKAFAQQNTRRDQTGAAGDLESGRPLHERTGARSPVPRGEGVHDPLRLRPRDHAGGRLPPVARV